MIWGGSWAFVMRIRRRRTCIQPALFRYLRCRVWGQKRGTYKKPVLIKRKLRVNLCSPFPYFLTRSHSSDFSIDFFAYVFMCQWVLDVEDSKLSSCRRTAILSKCFFLVAHNGTWQKAYSTVLGQIQALNCFIRTVGKQKEMGRWTTLLDNSLLEFPKQNNQVHVSFRVKSFASCHTEARAGNVLRVQVAMPMAAELEKVNFVLLVNKYVFENKWFCSLQLHIRDINSLLGIWFYEILCICMTYIYIPVELPNACGHVFVYHLPGRRNRRGWPGWPGRLRGVLALPKMAWFCMVLQYGHKNPS